MAASSRLAESAMQIGLAGVSNAMAATATNPVDVVKVRMQLDGEGRSSAEHTTARYRGVCDAASRLLREEGPVGFYGGLRASLCREMSYSGIRMGLYEPTKKVLGATDPTRSPLALKVLAGALTGASGSFLANPFDLVKVRMQSPLGSGGRSGYPSVVAAMRSISSEGSGIWGLWRGTGATVQRAALLTAAQVPSYDHSKHVLLDAGYLHEGYGCHFLCSMLAGVVAAAVTSPVDLVKSRLMVQPVDTLTGRGTLYQGLLDCCLKTVRTEGILALWKGFHTQWLRLGPHTTVSLMAFEQLRHLAGGRIESMIEAHRYVQNMPQILEMRLEDFDTNFNRAARTVYEHILGCGDPRVDACVQNASELDLGRMTPEDMAALGHPSDPEQESAVEAEMERLLGAGDQCMRLLVHQAGLLGYSTSSLF